MDLSKQQFKQWFDEHIEDYASTNQYRVSKIPFHTHNGVDSPLISPVLVVTVADASVAPTDTPNIATERYLIDNKSGTPHWYLWSFLPNVKTNVSGWHYIQLT